MSRVNKVKTFVPQIISAKWLRQNPDYIFVFGDNTIRDGYGGAATLRDEPNTYGFITKKFPDGRNSSFYTPQEYEAVYQDEINKLKREIESNPEKVYLITRVGDNLANRFGIFEEVIMKNIHKDLSQYRNVVWLW